MRVVVDWELCQGHGACKSEAPEVFGGSVCGGNGGDGDDQKPGGGRNDGDDGEPPRPSRGSIRPDVSHDERELVRLTATYSVRMAQARDDVLIAYVRLAVDRPADLELKTPAEVEAWLSAATSEVLRRVRLMTPVA